MTLRVRLDEVLSTDLLAAHAEHIRNFLLMEGVTPNPDDLGATVVTERQVKELMAELAHDLGQ
jgi:hypothetical protein